MDSIARALADPVGRLAYLAFCCVLLCAPIVALTFWYRARLARTAGGRAAAKERAIIGGQRRHAGRGVALGRDMASGRYGADARDLQITTCWLAGVWLVINALAFGLLLWADEVNRP